MREWGRKMWMYLYTFIWKSRLLMNLNLPFNKISSSFLLIHSITTTAFKKHVSSETGKISFLPYSRLIFSLTHVLLHTIPTSNLVFILTFVPLPSYRFWKPFVWNFTIFKNIMAPKYIGVIIQIQNRSLVWHFFSLGHILFSPSLMFCFTLFEIEILCLFL